MCHLAIDTVLPALIHRLEAHSETASLDAQVLIAHALGRPRTWVLAHPEIELSLEQYHNLQAQASRLEKGEPLPYILGRWEFFGLEFSVSPAALIPRPETELLVEKALEWLRAHPQQRRVIDVGTGCGCIAISLAVTIPDLRLVATDISLPALEIARRNAQAHQVSDRIHFLHRDLLARIPPGTGAGHSPHPNWAAIDLVCANLPYIPSGDLASLQVANYEPRLALDGGGDGLELIRRLLLQARTCLATGAALLLEIEERQGETGRAAALAAFPDAAIEVIPDLSGRDRLLRIQTSF